RTWSSNIASDPDRPRGVLAEQFPVADIAPERLLGLMTGLLHDHELAHAVHRRLGHAAGAQRVPAERVDLHACPRSGPLQELADRVLLETPAGRNAVAIDAAKHRPLGDPRGHEPRLQRADRT